MSRIAMAPDVAELTGEFAEKVENRSLLLDKFLFHKGWPVEEDNRGLPIKWDDASRWSFMRLADDAGTVLARETARLRKDAAGRNITPDNREWKLAQARISERLSRIAPSDPGMVTLRTAHTRRFLALFQNSQGDRGSVIVGRLEGRLAINLSDGLIRNANIALDRITGLPFIPGSAVKGACRHAAITALLAAEGAERRRLFCHVLRIFGAVTGDFAPAKPAQGRRKAVPPGDFHAFLDLMPEGKAADRKGAIDFLPAWPITPASIVVDLTNVHTPAYYSGDRRANLNAGQLDALAFEKPTVNPFPVVEAGASFAFITVLNGMADEPPLLTQATTWLREALTVNGLGAKTASGYGWFSIDEVALAKMESQVAAEATAMREREQARTLDPDPALMDEFRALKEQELVPLLNKYAFDPKFWPEETSLVRELTLFEFVKANAPHLTTSKNGGKAMRNLAEKLNRPFP